MRETRIPPKGGTPTAGVPPSGGNYPCKIKKGMFSEHAFFQCINQFRTVRVIRELSALTT